MSSFSRWGVMLLTALAIIGCTAHLSTAPTPKVGSVAPEIQGIDADGVAFKLSDYRGKVVLVDFWMTN
jgi:cytochrome oxidase Cu insertion factor (SCO1/SenC/PrrC family)